MPLQCTSCGYPAAVTPTCSECGGAEFHSTTTPPDRRSWPLLVVFLALYGLAACISPIYGVLEYRRSMMNLWTMNAVPKPASTDFWSIVGQYFTAVGVPSVVSLIPFAIGMIALVLAISVRRWRRTLTLAATLLCAQNVALLIWVHAANIISLY